MRQKIDYPILFLRHCKALMILALSIISLQSTAQINVTTGYTPAQMAAKLAGPGVLVFGATMTCPPNASGQFVTVSSILGLDSGIVLTSGTAKTSPTATGVDGPVSISYGTSNGAPGDADLTALAGLATFDACVLEFDFKPAGDTVNFKYVFGSSEYTSFTCTSFNDVFGFLISGGAFVTPTNLAKVPGTSIPVCINSVNCGPTGGGTLPTCTALGPGSPFCAYYVDNSAGTTISFAGLTVPLIATALVSPCDTYHLKLGVADGTDDALDSGVFIEAGSLTSRPPVTISGVGLSGLPYCVRGCLGGTFVFSIPSPQATPEVVHYNIVGTAINGYDYSTIADSITIAPGFTSYILNINPLIVPAMGPKTVTLQILIEDPCHPGVFVVGALSTITILDSFVYHIATPDTLICKGEFVHAIATGDTLFDSLLTYTWTPNIGVSNDTSLTPNLSPTITTTYVLTQTAIAALGCPAQQQFLTIDVYNRPILTMDSAYVKTCVGVPVQLHVNAVPGPPGTPNDYSWAAATYLNSTTIFDPTVNPLATGDYIYTVTVNPSAVPTCKSTDTVHVHVIGDFSINNHDTVICLGQSVPVTITGSNEISYAWTPTTGVVTATSKNPVITPPVQGNYTYTATGSYANCPDYVHSFHIHVDTPANSVTLVDTICQGMSTVYDFTVPGTDYYHYQWTSVPVVGITFSNDTLPNPTVTPTAGGNFVLTVTIQPLAAACATTNTVNLTVLPNILDIHPTDTAICAGQVVQVIGTGHPSFSYQWIPTAGIAGSTVLNTLITPDTSAVYIVTAHFHGCPDIHDTLNLDVQPNPSVYVGGNRILCQFDTLHLTANVSPAWYSGYSYSWSPAADLDHTTTRTVVFSGNTTTNLHVVVTTPAGCKSEDSALVTLFPGNFATVGGAGEFCPHDTAVLSVTPSSGVTYHWYPSMYLSDSLSGSPVISPIASQTYTIVATTTNGCRDTVNYTATVFPAGVIYLGDSVTLYPGESYHISPMTNCVNFAWFPPISLSGIYISDPVATPDVSTQYVVVASTEHGCKASDSISIYVSEESLLALPNAFTPGTGANNEFKIILRGIAKLNYFRIFNRWGNLLFETKDIEKGWDGAYKGEPQPFGVYVYQVQAVTSSGKIFNKTGNITIIR